MGITTLALNIPNEEWNTPKPCLIWYFFPGPDTQDSNQRERGHGLLEVKEEQGVNNNQLNYSRNLSPWASESSPSPAPISLNSGYADLAIPSSKSDNGLVSWVLWESRSPSSFPEPKIKISSHSLPFFNLLSMCYLGRDKFKRLLTRMRKSEWDKPRTKTWLMGPRISAH